LSIPGASDTANGAADIEARFFNVIRQFNPDAVVLDLTGSPRNGTATILKIRRRTGVPIVVVCEPSDPLMREYCRAGAADSMQAPIDIIELNQIVQKIIQLSNNSRGATGVAASQMQPVVFSGLTLHPHENRLVGADGSTVKLTTSENRVLIHFVNHPWALCTRDALAEVLYGSRRPTSDRAVDVIVTRLRKKIATLGGPVGQRLIKTEFRRGYMFVAEVSPGADPAAARTALPLQARSA
jgi:two-component system OmpR family response regulator